MPIVWITCVLITITASALSQDNNNLFSNSYSPKGEIVGNTIVNYHAPPGSKLGSFLAKIPKRNNLFSNVDSSNGEITANTYINYIAAGSDVDPNSVASSQQNLLSNIGSANGNIKSNQIINYYAGNNK